MNNFQIRNASPKSPGEAGTPPKTNPPFEVPEREEGEEYISINDDPKKIDVPRS